MSKFNDKAENFYMDKFNGMFETDESAAATKKAQIKKYKNTGEESFLEDVMPGLAEQAEENAEILFSTPRSKKKPINEYGYGRNDGGGVSDDKDDKDDEDDDYDKKLKDQHYKSGFKKGKLSAQNKESLDDDIGQPTSFRDGFKAGFKSINEMFGQEEEETEEVFDDPDDEVIGDDEDEIPEDEKDEMDKADEILEEIDLDIIDNATRLDLVRNIIDSAQNQSSEETEDGEEEISFDEFVTQLMDVVEEFQFDDEGEGEDEIDDEMSDEEEGEFSEDPDEEFTDEEAVPEEEEIV